MKQAMFPTTAREEKRTHLVFHSFCSKVFGVIENLKGLFAVCFLTLNLHIDKL
jgi:hypothetical protein